MGRERLDQLTEVVGLSRKQIEDSPSLLARAISAVVTSDDMRQPQFFSSLLLGLRDEELERLAEKHLEKPNVKRYDNAVALATQASKNMEPILNDLLDIVFLPSRLLPRRELKAPIAEDLVSDTVGKHLLEHQQNVVQKAMHQLSKGSTRLLIQMPTGAGKTRTALTLLYRMGWLTERRSGVTRLLWLAPSYELLEQAIDSLKALWQSYGTGDLRLVRAYGSSNMNSVIMEDGAVFATYHGLGGGHLARSNRRFRVIVCDEAHRAAAPTFKDAIEEALEGKNGSVLVGLSATPGRNPADPGDNVKLSKLFGKTIVRAHSNTDDVKTLRENGVLSFARRIEVFPDGTQSSGNAEGRANQQTTIDENDDRVDQKSLERLAHDQHRNRVIVNWTEDMAQLGRRIIVFGCTVAHARLLSSILDFEGYSSAFVDANIPRHVRAETVEQYRNGSIQILCNYGVFAAGFDVPGTDCIIIARPTTSIVTYSQMIGRGLRGPKLGGASETLIVEILGSMNDPIYQDASTVYKFFDSYWTRAQ